MNCLYNDFDIMHLPNYDSSVKLGNDIILIDNLSGENEDFKMKFQDFPIKLSFSITIICLSGEISFRINLNEYTLKANDMLIVQRGDIGEYFSKSDDCKIIAIAFADEYFQNTQYPGSTIFLQRMFREKPLYHLSNHIINECVTIFGMMKSKIAEQDNPYRKGALMGYMQVLLYNAYYFFESIGKESKLAEHKSSRKEEIFDKFIKAVHKDYRTHRSIMHYADVICISPKYLSQIVMQVSGKMAGEWIAEYVILEAKAMLKSRKYTIQQISETLNFTNQSFFGRYFKEKVGCSPSAYQKQDSPSSWKRRIG